MQRQRGEFEAAIEVYDEVITRFGTSDESDLQVAGRLGSVRKGRCARRQRGEFEAAIEAYDEVITRFGTSERTSPPSTGRLGSVSKRAMCKGNVASLRQRLKPVTK